MKAIQVSSKVARRLESLRRSGRAGPMLADKAERIIERLKSGTDRRHGDRAYRYTKCGEKRIRKCQKYDLGCGFRMITVLRAGILYVVYLGPHDECQRWLEGNSRMKQPEVGRGEVFHFASESTPAASGSPFDGPDETDDPLANLKDRDLRCIFRGLVESAGNRTTRTR